MSYAFDFAPVAAAWQERLSGCLSTIGLALAGMMTALLIGVGTFSAS